MERHVSRKTRLQIRTRAGTTTNFGTDRDDRVRLADRVGRPGGRIEFLLDEHGRFNRAVAMGPKQQWKYPWYIF